MLGRWTSGLAVWEAKLKPLLPTNELCSRIPRYAWPSLAGKKTSATDIARIRRRKLRSRHSDAPPFLLGRRYLQPERVPSSDWIVSAITIQIGLVAPEADWIGLQKAPNIWGVKAVAQIIQAKLAAPLLAGEEMAHAGVAAADHLIA